MPLSFPFLLLSGASAILSFLQASLLLFFPFYLSLHSLRIFLSSTKYLFSFKRRFSMLLIGIALHMSFNFFFSRRRFALSLLPSHFSQTIPAFYLFSVVATLNWIFPVSFTSYCSRAGTSLTSVGSRAISPFDLASHDSATLFALFSRGKANFCYS